VGITPSSANVCGEVLARVDGRVVGSQVGLDGGCPVLACGSRADFGFCSLFPLPKMMFCPWGCWRFIFVPALLRFNRSADLDRDGLFDGMVVLLVDVLMDVSATAADYNLSAFAHETTCESGRKSM
jgi:hypothetical protein